MTQLFLKSHPLSFSHPLQIFSSSLVSTSFISLPPSFGFRFLLPLCFSYSSFLLVSCVSSPFAPSLLYSIPLFLFLNFSSFSSLFSFPFLLFPCFHSLSDLFFVLFLHFFPLSFSDLSCRYGQLVVFDRIITVRVSNN